LGFRLHLENLFTSHIIMFYHTISSTDPTLLFTHHIFDHPLEVEYNNGSKLVSALFLLRLYILHEIKAVELMRDACVQDTPRRRGIRPTRSQPFKFIFSFLATHGPNGS